MKFLSLALCLTWLPQRIVTAELEVTTSAVIPVRFHRDQQSSVADVWEEMKHELAWAVDILVLETLALMSLSAPNEVQAQLPTTLRLSSGDSTSCPFDVNSSSHFDSCTNVFTSAVLLTTTEEDPLKVEEAFEFIFNSSVEHGRLQAILEKSFPDSIMSIPSNPSDPDEAIYEDEDEEDDSSYFGLTPTSSNTSSNVDDSSSVDLSMVSALGILIAACVALGFAMIALWVVRQKRRSAQNMLNGDNKNNHNNLNIQPQETDLDLVDTFSETGLEWIETPTGSEHEAHDDDSRNEEKIERPDNMQTLPYHLPIALQDDSSSRFQFSVPTPTSQAPSMAGFSVDSMASSEMYRGENFDGSEENTNIADEKSDSTESAVNLEMLEEAIVGNDWKTLAAAAQTLQSTTDNSAASSSDISENWAARDKTWRQQVEQSKAEEFDKLVEDGNWEGIVGLARQYGSTSGNSNNV